jgi:hypothetical protein
MVQDNDIKLILFKMRISNMLENQLQVENQLSAQLDFNGGMMTNTTAGRSNEKAVLSLYCQIFNRLVQSIVNGNKDIDAMQEAVDRKTVVEHSHVRTNIFPL